VSAAVEVAETLGPAPRVVFPRYRLIGPAGEVLKECAPPFLGVTDMLEEFRCQIGPGALFDRSLLGAVGGWDGSYRQIPDMEFWMRAARQATFVQFDGPRASFRVHARSQTQARASDERAEESVRIVAEAGAFEGLLGAAGCRRMTAAGYAFSAALHFKAGRPGRGWDRFTRSVRSSPATALRLRTLQRIAGAAYSNIRYRAVRAPRSP
jgi:hypothetical protein